MIQRHGRLLVLGLLLITLSGVTASAQTAPTQQSNDFRLGFADAILSLQPGPTAKRLLAKPPITVYVQNRSNDTIGAQLTYQTRELLRQSNGYTLVPSMEQAAVVIGLVSVDPAASIDNGNQSQAAVSYTIVLSAMSSLVQQGVMIVGRDVVSDQAASLVAVLDSSLHDAASHARTGWR